MYDPITYAIEGDFGAVAKCENNNNEPDVQVDENDAVHGENGFDFNLAGILISLPIQM